MRGDAEPSGAKPTGEACSVGPVGSDKAPSDTERTEEETPHPLETSLLNLAGKGKSLSHFIQTKFTSLSWVLSNSLKQSQIPLQTELR